MPKEGARRYNGSLVYEEAAPMPMYEYACEHCHHRFEKLQKMIEPRLSTCPKCEQNSLRRLVSATAFRLAGGGWYETEFKAKSEQRQLAGAPEPSGGSVEQPSKATTEAGSADSSD